MCITELETCVSTSETEGPTRPACRADNQLFCLRHVDEASVASVSGLDLRPRRCGASLEFGSCGSIATTSRGCQFITQPHGEINNETLSRSLTLGATPALDLLISPL